MDLLAKHGVIERNASLLLVLSLLVVVHRRHRRSRAAVLLPEHHRKGGGHAALHPARAGRPRHLCPRGLLCLPQPDDPAVPRRDRALRSLLAGGGVDVRPPVPVGLEADRSGSGPRRRPLFERLARRAPDGSARGGAGIDHAELRVPRQCRSSTTSNIAGHLQGQRHRGRALYRRDDRTSLGRPGRPGHIRMPTRPGCWPATPRRASRISTATRKRITEMDALVAYLQMLGTLVDFTTYDAKANYR